MFLLAPPMVGGGVIIGFAQDFKDQKTFKILYLLISKRKNINGTYFDMKVASNPCFLATDLRTSRVKIKLSAA